MEEILNDFLAETNEGLLAVEQQMLQLEKEPTNIEAVNDIFRVLHTIKGTCSLLGLNRLQQIAHYSESIFGKVREHALELDEDTLNILFEAIDRIKEIINELSKGEPEGDEAVDEILKLRLDTCARKQKSVAQTFRDNAPEPVIEEIAQPVLEINVIEEETPTFEEEPQYLQPIDTVVFTPDEIHSNEELLENNDPIVAVESLILKSQDEQLVMPPEKLAITEPVLHKVNSIRVDMNAIDHLIDLASEIVLLRNQLMQVGKNSNDTNLNALLTRLNASASQLQEAVMKTRMQPIDTVWQSIPRQVRDLCKESDKKVKVEMVGQDTEVDRQVLNLVKDPIMHMIYNAIDHGIETPEERIKANKPEEGTLTLKAHHENGYIYITVTDDGRGIDTEKIKESIVANGLSSQDELKIMDASQILNFIFNPGFSTASTISIQSGRGVGMDVVKANVEKIGGVISVDSKPEYGTVFNIKIPITLTVFASVICGCGSLRVAIPQAIVTEVVCISSRYDQTIEYVNASPVLRLRNNLVPLIMLHDCFGESRSGNESLVVCINLDGFKFGLVVDKVFDTQEIVIKPLAKILGNSKLFSGSAVLGDGSITLVLDVKALAENIFGNIDKSAKSNNNNNFDDQVIKKPKVALLIFKVEQFMKAIPLNMVKRITEVDLSTIVKVGEQYIHSDSNSVLPVITGKGMPVIDFANSVKLPMLVISDHKRQVGVIVSEIMDIVTDDLNIDPAMFDEDSVGTCVLNNIPANIINASYYLNTAYPDWFREYNG